MASFSTVVPVMADLAAACMSPHGRDIAHVDGLLATLGHSLSPLLRYRWLLILLADAGLGLGA